MVTLLILRHGKAAPESHAIVDRDRALTPEGQRAVDAVGIELAAGGLVPDFILCSSAERARDTAQRVARAARYPGSIVARDELYLAEPEVYLAALERFAGEAQRVLLVGHNPGLESLVLLLTAQAVSLPTAGLAQCTLPITAFAELSGAMRGELTRIASPKARAD